MTWLKHALPALILTLPSRSGIRSEPDPEIRVPSIGCVLNENVDDVAVLQVTRELRHPATSA
ncbi:MAG TPA: hypothetical protein VHI77_08835 [Solirubrobacterales bacterium]|jgi:hypothetical protein|nr:hypothetical protein [Solirubrobacterales bacterium]